jgi:hypothetical protein
MPYSYVCSFALHVFLYVSTSRDNDFELGNSNLQILSFFHLIFTVVIQDVKSMGSCAKAHI